MSFLLKIVEGPNKGAEIALVEGVAVTLGKTDACDIVLADATLGDEPIDIEASADGVTFGGEHLEPLHVAVRGSTAFAVGPSDSPWGELVWPRWESAPEREGTAEPEPRNEEHGAEGASPAPSPAQGEREPGKRRGCIGCLIALAILLLVIAVLCWCFRGWLEPKVKALAGRDWDAAETATSHDAVGGADSSKLDPLSPLVKRYGLATTNRNGRAILVGDFATRAERLAATAEAYAAQPGVELDISDDESFRAAAEDALFTLTEGALRVSQATNRFLTVDGSAHTPAALARTLKALNSDLPKLRNVDVKAVRFTAAADVEETAQGEGGTSVPAVGARARARKAAAKPEFPVCGILTAPYPCLVMKNGSRVLEGASVGGFVVEKIEADSVTVTNSTGRFTWKP